MNKVATLWLSTNMFHNLKDYFYFNKIERRGVVSLLFLLVLVIVINQSLVYFNPDPLDNSARYDSLIAEIENIKQAEKKTKRFLKKEISDFNPNHLTLQGWQNLGLSEKQAAVVLNYKTKAGKFKSKASVKKMFVISDSLYTQLEPHILLPDENPIEKKKTWKKFEKKKWEQKKWAKKVYPKVLFNEADTAELKKISGIGNFLSLNIVKYRESLGGFHSKEQLKEVFGITEELLNRIDTQLVYSFIPIKKLNINTANVEELKNHPYIKWKVANSIVKYRGQHGSYKKLTDLKKLVLISDSVYLKIEPYIEI